MFDEMKFHFPFKKKNIELKTYLKGWKKEKREIGNKKKKKAKNLR
jgi:hypothetical protein